MSKIWTTVTLQELAWPQDGTWPDFISVGDGLRRDSTWVNYYRVPELEAENEKLRELVKEMCVCLEDECERCLEWGATCDLEHRLCELGIEVDE